MKSSLAAEHWGGMPIFYVRTNKKSENWESKSGDRDPRAHTKFGEIF